MQFTPSKLLASPDLTRLSVIALRDLIACGEVTALEAVEQHIARLLLVNPQLNAMVVDQFDAARAQAREADLARSSGVPLGPLHGVPFTVKDCIDLAGTASTCGVGARAGHRAGADERHVARLRAAGAIPIAKSNVSQLLLYYEADNPLYGRTCNPHNPERTPGGSSGGEAALIAAFASPIGLGTDIGGSVRVPAAFCGITSFKPTSGRCDDIGDFWGPRGQRAVASQVGVLARHTADVALGLEVINGGPQPSAPGQPWRDFREVDVRGLRVGYYVDDGTFSVSPAVARAVAEAAAALREAGAQVRAWQPPDVPQALKLYYSILGADHMKAARTRMAGSTRAPQIALLLTLAMLPLWMARLLRVVLTWFGQATLANGLASLGADTVTRYWHLLEAQSDYEKLFSEAMDGDANAGSPLDVILCPPCALPAYPHGASKNLLTAGAYAALYNLLGYPAGVVPVTRVRADEQAGRPASRDVVLKLAAQVDEGSAGLPVGVQVVARPWQEHKALAAMQAIETIVTRKFTASGTSLVPPL